MDEKKYYFYLGCGGNCVKFITSLAHYNVFSKDHIIYYDPLGTSHDYLIGNGITVLDKFTDNFCITNKLPQEIVCNTNESYTYISIDNNLSRKFSLLNHFLKIRRLGGFAKTEENFNRFYQKQDKGLFKFENLTPSISNLEFADIYCNKKKVINFIENLTQKTTNHMLEVNYDRYLELQRKILIEKAPWFYYDEGKHYFT